MCSRYYELGVCLKKLHLVKVGAFAWYSVKIHVISMSGMKDETSTKGKPTWKLKHANFILAFFEYFCQMSSKSILIISSYTVSNLVRFLTHSVMAAFHSEHNADSVLYSA